MQLMPAARLLLSQLPGPLHRTPVDCNTTQQPCQRLLSLGLRLQGQPPCPRHSHPPSRMAAMLACPDASAAAPSEPSMHAFMRAMHLDSLRSTSPYTAICPAYSSSTPARGTGQPVGWGGRWSRHAQDRAEPPGG